MKISIKLGAMEKDLICEAVNEIGYDFKFPESQTQIHNFKWGSVEEKNTPAEYNVDFTMSVEFVADIVNLVKPIAASIKMFAFTAKAAVKEFVSKWETDPIIDITDPVISANKDAKLFASYKTREWVLVSEDTKKNKDVIIHRPIFNTDDIKEVIKIDKSATFFHVVNEKIEKMDVVEAMSLVV